MPKNQVPLTINPVSVENDSKEIRKFVLKTPLIRK